MFSKATCDVENWRVKGSCFILPSSAVNWGEGTQGEQAISQGSSMFRTLRG